MSGYENRGSRGGRFRRGGGGRGRGGYRGSGGGGGGGSGGGYFERPYNKRPPTLRYNNHHKRTRFEVTQRLKETDIGVTEFVGHHEHFSGIVKERFNDFQVHEINMEGEISELTNQDIPPEPEHAFNLEDLEKTLPQETIDKIESLSQPDGEVKYVEIDVTDLNKDERRVLHTLGKLLPSILSQTIDKDDKKVLVLMKGHNKKPYTRFYKDQRTEWNFKDNYCHFVLHKMNMDTMDALNQMAMYMHVKPNCFSYAGTKDRRARTTQWICLKRVHPAKILEAGRRVPGAFVGNFKFANEPLKLGQLQGNHFTIVLRNVNATDEEIEAAVTSLRDKGFINYYGLQRFGTVAAVPTHHIGKALMQGNWQEAVDLILKPRSGDFYELAEARAIYAETKDAQAALKKLRQHDKLEAKMLRGICIAGPTNPQGALDYLPRHNRTMYIHAYQSFVWNSMVSKRIREFGFKPVVGDLVYEQPDTKEQDSIEDTEHHDDSDEKVENGKANGHTEEEVVEDETEEKAENEAVHGHAEEQMAEDKSEEKSEDDAGKKSEDNPEKKSDDEMEEDPAPKVEDAKADKKETPAASRPKKKNARIILRDDDPVERDYHPVPAVKVLTEEDLPNYTIADVVMPQPGWRIVYPTYAKEWYEKFLAEDGLTTDLRRKNKKYSLGGQYRKIVQIPKNVSWKVVRYNDLKADLVSADIEKYRKQNVTKIDPEGKHKALILEMTLASSSYATMALRELLKHDTSPEIQAAQSAAHHAKDEEERMQEAKEAKKAEDAKVEEEKKENETTATESAESEDVKMEADEENVKMEAEEENIKTEAEKEEVKAEPQAENAEKMEIAEEVKEEANQVPVEPVSAATD